MLTKKYFNIIEEKCLFYCDNWKKDGMTITLKKSLKWPTPQKNLLSSLNK